MQLATILALFANALVMRSMLDVFTSEAGYFINKQTGCNNDCGCQTGACCKPDGTCEIVTSDTCAAHSGTFHGVGSTCTTNLCTGACCTSTSACTQKTLAQCQAAPGTFFGLGTSCTPSPCPTGFCNGCDKHITTVELTIAASTCCTSGCGSDPTITISGDMSGTYLMPRDGLGAGCGYRLDFPEGTYHYHREYPDGTTTDFDSSAYAIIARAKFSGSPTNWRLDGSPSGLPGSFPMPNFSADFPIAGNECCGSFSGTVVCPDCSCSPSINAFESVTASIVASCIS